MSMWGALVLVFCTCGVWGKLDMDDEPQESSGDLDLDDSLERIGAAVAQVFQHPYAASLIKNDTYICSAVVLNKYWLLTLSKCFDSGIISSYVVTHLHQNLSNYAVRAGSSYNNKGGALYQIKMLINNFDLRVSAVKLQTPMVFSSQVKSVRLPEPEEEVSLGYLAAIIAWTPSGHMRVVNAPVIDPDICEMGTKMLPGHYVCLGGVQDPNRHFCRRDNGGAVIQNSTLIAISSYINTCALYSKTHAFPKVTSFTRWLDSVIWDEDARPSTTEPPKLSTTTRPLAITTKGSNSQPYYADPGKFMLTLPFAPINVPLEPAEDNQVLPRMSLYESYLQSFARAKTLRLTTETPKPTNQRTEAPVFRKPSLSQLYRHGPITYDRYDYH